MDELSFAEDFDMPDWDEDEVLEFRRNIYPEKDQKMDEISTFIFDTNNILDELIDELIEAKRVDILELLPKISKLEIERMKKGLSEYEDIDIQIEIMDIGQEKEYKE